MGAFVCAATAVAAVARGSGSSSPGGLIVYWVESPFPTIWAIRPDGSGRHRVLRTRQNADRPALSPDRRWVAFDGAPPGKPPLSDFDVEIVRLDGSGLRTLTTSSEWDLDAQWSPDGKLLSFSRLKAHARDEHLASVWIVDRDGSGLRRLVRGFGARWSPDGTKLVYEAPAAHGEANLSVIGASGRSPHPLLTAAGVEQPAGWSADGKRILFTRYDAVHGASVFVTDSDGTGLKRLGDGIAGSWSPDGRKIVYASSFGGPLFVMNADGSDKRRLTSFGAAASSWR